MYVVYLLLIHCPLRDIAKRPSERREEEISHEHSYQDVYSVFLWIPPVLSYNKAFLKYSFQLITFTFVTFICQDGLMEQDPKSLFVIRPNFTSSD